MAIRELKVCLLGVSPEPPAAGYTFSRAPPTSPAPHRPCAPVVPCAPLVCVSPLLPAPPSFRVPLGPCALLFPRILQYVRPLFPGAPLVRVFPCPRAPSSLGIPPLSPRPWGARVRLLLGFGSETVRELSRLLPPRPAGFPGSARASPRCGGSARAGRPGPCAVTGGAVVRPAHRRGLFSRGGLSSSPLIISFRRKLSYSAKARSPLLPPGGNWFIHFTNRTPS